MLENLSDSLNNAGFDIANIGSVHELSSALDTIGIDIAALGDYQMDLLLDALHHNGMTVADMGHTAPDAHATETSAMTNTIVGGIVTGAAAGLKDTMEKAVKETYDGLNQLIKGYWHRQKNLGKK